MNNEDKKRLLSRIGSMSEVVALSVCKTDRIHNAKMRVLRHILQYHGEELEEVREYLYSVRRDKETEIANRDNEPGSDDKDFLVASHVVTCDMLVCLNAILKDDTDEGD